MAKREKKKIIVRATYSEGCSDRLTQALVDIYYDRKMRGESCDIGDKKENTA
ncbi:MAG: hypothetical protein PUB46_00150 [Lachnospiraceae bacterium]|nr:hypothetical protein [Lachnospiraceae bacterium]